MSHDLAHRQPYRRPPGPPRKPDLWDRIFRLLRPSSLRMLAVLIILALAALGVLPPETIRGTAEVIDGDTLIVGGERMRLYGIDAPELDQPCLDGQPCGARARDHLAKFVAWRSLLCERRDSDRYGRDVVQCYLARQDSEGKQVKGADIGRAMVRDGYAMAYRDITTLYVEDEPAQFDFEPPWRWRASHATEERPQREAGPRVRRPGESRP